MKAGNDLVARKDFREFKPLFYKSQWVVGLKTKIKAMLFAAQYLLSPYLSAGSSILHILDPTPYNRTIFILSNSQHETA